MKYITVEQFKEQPLEVQKVFIDWWKPTIGDLFAWNYSDENENDLHKIQCCASESIINLTKCNKGLEEGDRIPLLTEGQLREFIEDKTNCKVIPNLLGDTQFSIELYRLGERCFTEIKAYDHLGSDLLQAYWKVACEIAKEECKR